MTSYHLRIEAMVEARNFESAQNKLEKTKELLVRAPIHQQELHFVGQEKNGAGSSPDNRPD